MRTAAGERQGEKKCPGNKTVCTIRSGAAEHRCEEPSCMKAGAGHWAGSAHSTAQHSTAQHSAMAGGDPPPIQHHCETPPLRGAVWWRWAPGPAVLPSSELCRTWSAPHCSHLAQGIVRAQHCVCLSGRVTPMVSYAITGDLSI